MLHFLLAARSSRPSRRRAVGTSPSPVETLEVRVVPAFLSPVSSQGNYRAVGDFNGDGKADLVVVDAETVSIRLGKGDGTFKAAANSQRIKGLETGTMCAVGD